MSDNSKKQNTGKSDTTKSNTGKTNQNKQNQGKQKVTRQADKGGSAKQPVKAGNSAKGSKRTSPVNDFVDRLRDDRKFAAIVGGAILAVLIVIVLIIVFTAQKSGDEDREDYGTDDIVTDAPDETVSDNENTQAEETAEAPEEVTTENGTVSDEAVSETDMVNALVDKYFASLAAGDVETITAIKNQTDEKELLKIQKKSAYIESFENVNVYTKPGPVDNSYVAFVYYEIKFKDLNTLAPGLITLYMSAAEDGSLRIFDGQLDEQLDESVTDYIKELAVTEEIVALFDKVKVKYNEAVDSDAELKAFIEGLSDRLEAEVAAAMAENQPAEETTETAETNETANQKTETVVATDTVNVRSSDSENADRLGKLEVGTKVTRYEAKGNGWSKIDYNGQEAYVKSEYLKVDDGSTPAKTETESTAQTDNSTATGEKVTVKETVKIRKSASTDGEILATAYMGEQFELVMKQADGWTKIKYNGQTAYIKSEFLE